MANLLPNVTNATKGIARLPVDELKECGIRYAFTNCRQDSFSYPILHEKKKARRRPDKLEDVLRGNGEVEEPEERIVCSQHLEVSSLLFADVRQQNYSAGRDGNREEGGGDNDDGVLISVMMSKYPCAAFSVTKERTLSKKEVTICS